MHKYKPDVRAACPDTRLIKKHKLSCEEVKKSKKLLCSQVKIGSEIKQIVSGIKRAACPDTRLIKKHKLYSEKHQQISAPAGIGFSGAII